MLIQTRSIIVEKGNSEQVVERFSGPGPLYEMEGLIDYTVMVNKRNKEQEEVLVMIRWESEEAWKNWEKSDAHLEGHPKSRGQEKPAYVVSTSVNMYQVQAVKEGKASGKQL
ncbi:heme-degrading monooxygenase HmoA [Paenibacillus albidus]|uniref:Heme-degrading monooxygenase HmoA n=1 Tax=Paenibacillus albidus TaxID=2041023 RepID=A0A917C2K3_9BACL|nr:antibiotic biosynthesis monooxygenase [Paenibacillus albidus]GGF67742.1 heme-degrading monooxygenase HmoA [Paenibacillus albidus]